MAVDAPTPVPGRPSDLDREQIVRSLRDGTVSGRISPDTFSRRVDRVYRARNRRELDDLLADLSPSDGLERVLQRAVERTSTTLSGLRAAWHEPQLERIALPRAGAEVTLGRSPGCDYVIGNDTVSRRHASIRRVGERWLLSDLGSMNGTRLNGWRVVDEVELVPGDQLSIGAVRFRVTAPRL